MSFDPRSFHLALYGLPYFLNASRRYLMDQENLVMMCDCDRPNDGFPGVCLGENHEGYCRFEAEQRECRVNCGLGDGCGRPVVPLLVIPSST